MRQNTGLFAGLALLAAILGVSTLPNRSTSTQGMAEAPKPAGAPVGKAKASAKPNSPCNEIQKRLSRFLEAAQQSENDSWLPGDCYAPAPRKPAAPKSLPGVRFAIATVPNPISTHLALQFDHAVEAIQQAAQDNGYSYDDSWLPWDAGKDYERLPDQLDSEDLREVQQAQPGVMTFRNDTKAPYTVGLIFFLIGEKPTGGISDTQFDAAIRWITQLGGLSNEEPLRILGPTFSGSLPSLQLTLEHSGIGARPVWVSSGSVSSFDEYARFRAWIKQRGLGSHFWTAYENDRLMTERFCSYLAQQQYDVGRLAFLSEDETAFGGSSQTTPDAAGSSSQRPSDDSAAPDLSPNACQEARELRYPRDIAALRSAYEQQAILSPAKPPGSATAPSTTLRGDLSEPDNSDHDTVRTYGGQLTPLAQEAILLDIVNRLNDQRIEFILVRSTNSLDQIFLGKFLRRAYPQGRVVFDGADLLFTRGSDGAALRGVMALSNYPLLTLESKWVPPLLTVGPARTFANDMSEGVYIAARDLFIPSRGVPIQDYGAPVWAAAPESSRAIPPTWLTVVGRGQFWPVAALTQMSKDAEAKSILTGSHDRGDGSPIQPPSWKPELPVWMEVLLLALLALAFRHLYCCLSGAVWAGRFRFQAYFTPQPGLAHPTLIALGSLIPPMLAVVAAAASGVLARHETVVGFQTPLALWWLVVFLTVWIAACAACYVLVPTLRSSLHGKPPIRWRVIAPLAGLGILGLFVLLQFRLVSNLVSANAVPAYWRSVNLFSGVSPLLPQILFLAGAYAWIWCSLRGRAHFGNDRPMLPPKAQLPPAMSLFSQDVAGQQAESAARPLSPGYLWALLGTAAVTVCVCLLILGQTSVRTLGERTFGTLIFCWMCLFIAVILADSFRAWFAWNRLRQLLIRLDRLAFRRTMRQMSGVAWGSIWKMTENVFEERYRLTGFQMESLRRLKNAFPSKSTIPAELTATFQTCEDLIQDFANWYVRVRAGERLMKLEFLPELQAELAGTAAVVTRILLLPEWSRQTKSLISGPPQPDGKGSAGPPAPNIPLHIRAAEEFVILTYVAFIQNILGRIRTIFLGIVWLFVTAALAMASYPFDPLDALRAIFLAVFLIVAVFMIVIYAQMSRDATLSHLTNTTPGELGWDFWLRLGGFGIGPLLACLATWFPSVTDFVFSWLQPGAQALK
jgi:hypothetical protein